MKLLVIEDEKTLADSLKVYFEALGFVVDCVYEGAAGQQRIELYHNDYDAVILDWMLPEKSGIDICRAIRKSGITIPVIILTGRTRVEDRIAGLDCGADDYLTKPFSPEELFARVKAITRRPKSISTPALVADDITLNQDARRVFVGKKEIRLTFREFELLEYLMQNPDRVLNREQIFTHVWDWANNAMSNVVDVHMHSLRKKLGKAGKALLETVPGVGYRLRAPS